MVFCRHWLGSFDGIDRNGALTALTREQQAESLGLAKKGPGGYTYFQRDGKAEYTMPYKYEVHMHTHESSACGKTPAVDYIAEFKRLGYDGMIITDHFYHGNTRPERNQPWESYINEFCRGYEEAKAEGDRQGLKVFFAWEENFSGDEYLVYGCDKAWLLAHPEYLKVDQTEQLKMIHEAGGAVVQAHPFRERGYLSTVNVHPFQCDAMEACNFGNPPYQDILAYNFCKTRGITMTSGTDLHDVSVLPGSIAGMLFDEPLTCIQDYVRAIRTGKGFTPLIPEERRHLQPDTVNTLPIQLWDESNKAHSVTLKDLGLVCG